MPAAATACGSTAKTSTGSAGEQHRYEPQTRTCCDSSPSLRAGQQAFRMAAQIALLEYDDLIDRTGRPGAFAGTGRAITDPGRPGQLLRRPR